MLQAHTTKSFSLIFILATSLFLLNITVADASIIVRPVHHFGLIGYWNFNEGEGTVVQDKSGNLNHGNLNHMATSTNGGWADSTTGLGSALVFDGVDDYIALTRVCDTLPCSVTGWLYADALPGARNGVFRNNDNTTNFAGLGLFVFTDGTVSIRLGDSIGLGAENQRTYDTAAGIIQLTQWHHYAVIATTMTDVILFIDGQQVAVSLVQGTGTTYNPGTGGAVIGRAWRDPSGGYYSNWVGRLDDVRIYNRALSPQEITRLYAIRKPKVSTVQLSKGLVGYWDFNEGEGGVVNDRSGQNNHGNLTFMATNTDPVWVDSTTGLGKTLQFGGVDDYVEIADPGASSVLDLPGDFSVSAWIYSADLTFPGSGPDLFPRIVQKGFNINSSGSWGFSVDTFDGGSFCDDPNVMHFTFNANSSHNCSTTALTTGRWYHVAVTRVGAALTFYLDSVPDGVTTIQSTPFNASDESFYIGQGPSDSTGAWNGLIDDVRLYNRALSPQEITRLYTMRKPKVSTVQLSKGLVGYWDFNEGEGAKAHDRSGNLNHGNLNHMATSTNGGWADSTTGLGSALVFDGVDDYVNTGYAPTINSVTSFTIALWFKVTKTTTTEFAVGSADTSPFSFMNLAPVHSGCSSPTGAIMWEMDDTTNGDGVFLCSANAFNDGNWHQAVGILNRDTSQALLYVDGVLEGTASSALIGTINLSGNPFYIGDYNSNGALGGASFNGPIDDVRMYSRALSAQEAVRLYTMGR